MKNYYSSGLYRYKDLASKYKTLPESLKGEHMTPSSAILQLLMGKIIVYDNNDKIIYKKKDNYIELPFKIYDASKKKNDLEDYKVAFEVSLFDNETKQYLDKYLRFDNKNNFVYNHVLYELTQALASMDCSPMESFVHIYRVLEFISYTFPLIYSSKSKDYLGSFKSLKEYFSGGNEIGELKFFDKFIETLFQDDEEIYSFVFEIFLDTEYLEQLKREIYDSIVEKSRNGVENYYIEGNTLKISFSKMQTVLIEIRNKFFHMLVGNGRKNFFGMDYDINDFFRSINPYFINWIASIYVKIFQYRIEIS